MRAAFVEFAIVTALCAVAFFVVIPAEVPSQRAIGLQADVVPRAAVVVIAALAFAQLLFRLAKARGSGAAISSGPRQPFIYVLILLAAVTIGVGVIMTAGFLVGAVALVFLVSLAVGERRPVRLLLHAAGAAGVILLVRTLGL